MAFTSHERVEEKLGGSVLLIEGRHESDVPGAGEPRTVHHALAMLGYDAAAGHYTFQAQTVDQGGGTYEGRLTDEGFVWGMETPQERIRYTITNADDEWLEVGDFSRDGENWQQFFEMRLHRKDGMQ